MLIFIASLILFYFIFRLLWVSYCIADYFRTASYIGYLISKNPDMGLDGNIEWNSISTRFPSTNPYLSFDSEVWPVPTMIFTYFWIFNFHQFAVDQDLYLLCNIFRKQKETIINSATVK